MDSQVLKILAECPLFRQMTEEDIHAVLATVSCRIIHIGKNQLYALSGDACLYASIVLKGEMRAEMGTASGKFVEVTTLRKGNVIAPAFIFANIMRCR